MKLLIHALCTGFCSFIEFYLKLCILIMKDDVLSIFPKILCRGLEHFDRMGRNFDKSLTDNQNFDKEN